MPRGAGHSEKQGAAAAPQQQTKLPQQSKKKTIVGRESVQQGEWRTVDFFETVTATDPPATRGVGLGTQRGGLVRGRGKHAGQKMAAVLTGKVARGEAREVDALRGKVAPVHLRSAAA